MTDLIDMDEAGWTFLKTLFESIGGEAASQVSMYDIGAKMGLDRDAASKTAQELIGWGLVEIKTLSGGIGITEDGMEAARERFGAPAKGGAAKPTLADMPVVDESLGNAIEETLTLLKTESGNRGLAYDKLQELMADLKTIDAQMASPNPKTAILTEAFRSVQALWAEAGSDDLVRSIRDLMGA